MVIDLLSKIRNANHHLVTEYKRCIRVCLHGLYVSVDFMTQSLYALHRKSAHIG